MTSPSESDDAMNDNPRRAMTTHDHPDHWLTDTKLDAHLVAQHGWTPQRVDDGRAFSSSANEVGHIRAHEATLERVVEDKDYEVTVTLTFAAIVRFAPIERDAPLTHDDAIANFYGMGLSDVLDSGEYGISGHDSVTVREIGASQSANRPVLRQAIGIQDGMTANDLIRELRALPATVRKESVTVLNQGTGGWTWGGAVAIWVGDEGEPVVEFKMEDDR